MFQAKNSNCAISLAFDSAKGTRSIQIYKYIAILAVTQLNCLAIPTTGMPESYNLPLQKKKCRLVPSSSAQREQQIFAKMTENFWQEI